MGLLTDWKRVCRTEKDAKIKCHLLHGCSSFFSIHQKKKSNPRCLPVGDNNDEFAAGYFYMDPTCFKTIIHLSNSSSRKLIETILRTGRIFARYNLEHRHPLLIDSWKNSSAIPEICHSFSGQSRHATSARMRNENRAPWRHIWCVNAPWHGARVEKLRVEWRNGSSEIIVFPCLIRVDFLPILLLTC